MPDRFTDSFVRGLKPDAKEYVRRDGMNPGLAVRVHPTGRKTWLFFYDYRGRRRKMTLGTYPDVPLRSARDRYHEARLARNQGHDPGQVQVLETIQSAQTPNVEELAEAYVDRHARYRKQTKHRWLYYEIVPQISWDEEYDYKFNPGVRFRLEFFFGKATSSEFLQRELEGPHQWGRLAAAIVLDEMDDQAKPAIGVLKAALENQPNKYIIRVANRAVNELQGTNHTVP